MPLSPGMWTDDLVTPKSVKNPRLIYDVFYSFLLVQGFYYCHCENHPSRRFLSSDIRILTQLPNEILVKFQIIKYHRCLFSYQLVDYIFDQISRGVNFLQVFKAIAQLHINTYCRLHTTFPGNDAYNKVLENVMFSFPSSDKVKDVFLDVFNVRKEQYILDIESIPIGSMIAAEATFKISKPIGFRRKEDNKIVRQYNNLFIVLNGNREVVQWKLCLNLKHEEIREMLEKIAERNPNIEKVLVDNCCAERQLYLDVFPQCRVQLDIFHAVQRFTRELPRKRAALTKKLSAEYGLVFRCRKTDQGQKLTMTTSSKEIILSNLNLFLRQNIRHFEAVPQTYVKNMDK